MALDYGDQSYFPAWKTRLTIRFDEFGQVNAIKTPPPAITSNLKGVGGNRAPLVVTKNPSGFGFTLLVRGQSQAQPATQQATSADGLTYDVTCIPKEIHWMMNGLRSASQAQLVLKFVDLPFDPRCVRSCAVEVFIGSVSAAEYQAGIAGGRRGTSLGSPGVGPGEPLNLIQDTYLDSNNVQRTNSRLQGWVDKWNVEWKGGEPEIHLDCTDNTRLFINQEAPPKLVLDASKPLDAAIANYLANFPQFNGLNVQYLPTSTTPPILKDILHSTALAGGLGPPVTGGGSTTSRPSVWDYLCDNCGSIGHVIRLSGPTVLIQPVRSLLNLPVNRPDDPFQGRTLKGSGVRLNYRTFIYGENILEMSVARNYARKAPTNVEVRSYGPDSKVIGIARFPLNNPSNPNAGRLASAIPGNAQPEQKWTVAKVYGIKDQTTLNQMAQGIYESISRQEFEVDVQTHNLASFGAGNLDPDILDMEPGDTFEILTRRDATDEVNTLNKMEQSLLSFNLSAQYLQRLGFSQDIANAYAKAYTNAGFLTTFKLRKMKVSCSIESGIDFHLTGTNYLEVRMDQSLPAGQEPGGQSDPPANNTPQSTNPGVYTPPGNSPGS